MEKDSQAPVLARWLQAIGKSAGSISEKTGDLVDEVLKVKWYKYDLGEPFAVFVETVVSAQPFYVVPCMKSVVSCFRMGMTIENKEWAHEMIRLMVELVPAVTNDLVKWIKEEFPYKHEPVEVQINFLDHCLAMTETIPAISMGVLDLIINRMLQLDVEIQIEVDDLDEEQVQVIQNWLEQENAPPMTPEMQKIWHVHSMVERLDLMMNRVFEYLNTFNEDQKHIFLSVLAVFERSVLRTFQARHVPFLVFYLCSLNEEFPDIFLGLLGTKVFNNNQSPNDPIRLSSVSYYASFLSRAKYLNENLVISCFYLLLDWVEENFEPSLVLFNCVNALLYIFCFRHEFIVQGERSSIMLRSRLEKIIQSPMNPLRFCIPSVVEEFASICSNMGFLYCFNVIEKNKKFVDQSIECFFPFDPFRLKTSKVHVNCLYNEWGEEELIEIDK